MKQLLSMIGAVVLLAAPYNAKAQSTASRDGLTIPEFRQVLVDLGTYLDAHKGTNLASQFSALPDSALGEIYPACRMHASYKPLSRHSRSTTPPPQFV